MDNPELVEDAEIDLDRLIVVFHKNGLNYWEILRMFLDYCPKLLMQADCEYHLKLGK